MTGSNRPSFGAILAAALLAIVIPELAAAHAQWLLVQPARCAPGDSVHLELGSGHAFPTSEAAEDPDEAAVWAVAPDGTRRQLTMLVAGTALRTSYLPAAPGCHRVFFAADRGVISRTADGWQDGGRDVWPDTELSLNYFIGSLAPVMVGQGEWMAEPLGLPLELQVEAAAMDSVHLRAYLAGTPAAELEIRLWAKGGGFAPIGMTDGDGRFVFAQNLATGDRLFLSATYTRDWEPGSRCDRDMFRCNLVLDRALLR